MRTIAGVDKGFPKNKVCSNLLSSNVYFLKTFSCNLSPFLKHSFQISFINSGPVHFSGSLDYKVWGKVCSSGRQYHQLHHSNTFKFAWCIFTKIEKEEVISIFFLCLCKVIKNFFQNGKSYRWALVGWFVWLPRRNQYSTYYKYGLLLDENYKMYFFVGFI